MRIGTNFEQSKLMSIINDGGDISLLIDHHLDDEKLKTLKKKIDPHYQNATSWHSHNKKRNFNSG